MWQVHGTMWFGLRCCTLVCRGMHMPGLQLVVVACNCLQVLPTSSVARRVLHSAGVVTPVCRMLQGGDACGYC